MSAAVLFSEMEGSRPKKSGTKRKVLSSQKSLPPVKIQYMSDLHLEFASLEIPFVDRDVLVLAGDIARFSNFATLKRVLIEQAAHSPVIMVAGNHEYYGANIDYIDHVLLKWEADIPGFFFLNNSQVSLKKCGRRFLGATFWSNCGGSRGACARASWRVNDYRMIKNWSIHDHVKQHNLSKQILAGAISPGDIVVTHFPPTLKAIDTSRFKDDELNSWFANDYDALVKLLEPAAWISGHTHNVWDEVIGKTRVVGNCRGYCKQVEGTAKIECEVKAFDPSKVIVV